MKLSYALLISSLIVFSHSKVFAQEDSLEIPAVDNQLSPIEPASEIDSEETNIDQQKKRRRFQATNKESREDRPIRPAVIRSQNQDNNQEHRPSTRPRR
jgi:hypothetical protein